MVQLEKNHLLNTWRAYNREDELFNQIHINFYMNKTHTSSFSITTNDTSNASLKGKITALESLMYEVADVVEIHRKEY